LEIIQAHVAVGRRDYSGRGPRASLRAGEEVMDRKKIKGLLQGAVDMHVHCAPDTVPRKLDAMDVALHAKRAGLRAVVLKSHAYNTAPVAALVESRVPGVRVLGGVALNHPVGGVNPAAVDAALRLGAKVVWMPTVSARNHVERVRSSPNGGHLRSLHGGRGEGLTILDSSGRILPEVLEVIRLVRDADGVLATGHLGLPEVKALAEASYGEGLRKLVITHPELEITRIPDEDQRELASLGAYFERCWFASSKLGPGLDPCVIARSIREVGAGSTILSSDMGQVENSLPVEEFEAFLRALLRCGVQEDEISLMIRENPIQLLGL
jgi:hypothetical protein